MQRSGRVAERVWFLRKFLREPAHVASLWPSSRWLAAAMVRDLALPSHHTVLEFGPGTGAFTHAIDAVLRHRPERDSFTERSYFGIERDPEFVALLRARFPLFEFCLADVAMLPELLAQRPSLQVGAVVCGLPLVAMPEATVDRLLREVASRLPAGGTFRTFSYVHTMLNPASWRLRRRMRGIFRAFRVRGPIVRNVPPALVFEGAM